ncbi:hypothetical protein FB480_103358 [Agrobacterium vitis]|nr:hypothetical protein FB480_103358 [Agrobacterium vitis]
MTYRLWYAQLDLFDTMRRYIALLSNWKLEPPSSDRLFVSDFYFVNPTLLHKTHMTNDVRNIFKELRVPKPEETFIQLPSPAILYDKMGGIQAQALHNLIGKGLLDIELVNKDQYKLSKDGRALASQLEPHLVLAGEETILEFLTKDFATLGQGKGALRKVTALRRIGT